MLLSPAILQKSFQQVHFTRKLSQSLKNMTRFYNTLKFSAKLFENRTP